MSYMVVYKIARQTAGNWLLQKQNMNLPIIYIFSIFVNINIPKLPLKYVP